MENIRTMTVQIPKKNYQRMQEYLLRHGMKQKDFIRKFLERAMEYSQNSGGT